MPTSENADDLVTEVSSALSRANDVVPFESASQRERYQDFFAAGHENFIWDEAAEQTVVGAALRDSVLREYARDHLVPDRFFDLRHKAIFAAIESLADKRGPINVGSVEQALRESGELNKAGGAGRLRKLAEAAADLEPSDLADFINRIIDTAVHRWFIDLWRVNPEQITRLLDSLQSGDVDEYMPPRSFEIDMPGILFKIKKALWLADQSRTMETPEAELLPLEKWIYRTIRSAGPQDIQSALTGRRSSAAEFFDRMLVPKLEAAIEQLIKESILATFDNPPGATAVEEIEGSFAAKMKDALSRRYGGSEPLRADLDPIARYFAQRCREWRSIKKHYTSVKTLKDWSDILTKSHGLSAEQLSKLTQRNISPQQLAYEDTQEKFSLTLYSADYLGKLARKHGYPLR